MLEQFNNRNEDLSQNLSSFENDELVNDRKYAQEMIEYLDKKIAIEQSLGHSVESLEHERQMYIDSIGSDDENKEVA